MGISGEVTPDRVAVIYLTLRGPAGEKADVEAALDTGFTDFLVIPQRAGQFPRLLRHPLRGRSSLPGSSWQGEAELVVLLLGSCLDDP